MRKPLVIAVPSEAKVPVAGSIMPTFSLAGWACTKGAGRAIAAAAPAVRLMKLRRPDGVVCCVSIGFIGCLRSGLVVGQVGTVVDRVLWAAAVCCGLGHPAGHRLDHRARMVAMRRVPAGIERKPVGMRHGSNDRIELSHCAVLVLMALNQQ